VTLQDVLEDHEHQRADEDLMEQRRKGRVDEAREKLDGNEEQRPEQDDSKAEQDDIARVISANHEEFGRLPDALQCGLGNRERKESDEMERSCE
jgi:hypothetical protein